MQKAFEINPPCRFERISEQYYGKYCETYKPEAFVMDVAHNPPAIEMLIRTAQVLYPDCEIHAICGFSKNKDVKAIFESLIPNCARLYLISPHHFRAQAFEAVLEARDEFKNTHPEIVKEDQLAPPIEGGNIEATIKAVLSHIEQ